jgi:single-strand DNA-binding protein
MLNQVALIGTLGRDPELRYANSGTAIANLTIAVNDGYGDNRKTYWFYVTCFGKTAESVEHYTRKGSKIAVSGKLVQDEYEKDGKTVRKTHINAFNVHFLDPKPDSQQNQGAYTPGPPAQNPRQQQFQPLPAFQQQPYQQPQQGVKPMPPFNADGTEMDDQIPF